MARIPLIALAFAAFAAGWLPAPSEAHWQNTRWQMTLEQLFAERENLQRTTAADRRGEAIEILGTPLAKGEYSTKQHRFEVYFYFRDSGLSGVRLEAKEPEKAALIFNELKLTYGIPAEALDKPTPPDCRSLRGAWRDEKNGNAIMLAGFVCESASRSKFNVVRIVYQPILAPSKGGL